MSISLQSFNYPDRYVRHANFLGELTQVVTDLDRNDATFHLIPAVTDSYLISIRSHNFGTHVLRHQNFRVRLDAGVQPPEDATFIFVIEMLDEAELYLFVISVDQQEGVKATFSDLEIGSM
jgi:hypothetical protein